MDEDESGSDSASDNDDGNDNNNNNDGSGSDNESDDNNDDGNNDDDGSGSASGSDDESDDSRDSDDSITASVLVDFDLPISSRHAGLGLFNQRNQLKRETEEIERDAKRHRRALEYINKIADKVEARECYKCGTEIKRFCNVFDLSFEHVLSLLANDETEITIRGFKIQMIMFNHPLETYQFVLDMLDKFVWCRRIEDGDHAIGRRVVSMFFKN